MGITGETGVLMVVLGTSGYYKVVWGTIRSGCIIVLSASVSSSVSVVDKNNNTSILYVLCSGPCTLPWYWLIVKFSTLLK